MTFPCSVATASVRRDVITELRLRLLGSWRRRRARHRAGKEVFLEEWTTRRIDEAEVRSWPPRLGPNDGARTEFHPCLDLDIRDGDGGRGL